MQTQALIQTNHGISYPFVGPARMGQAGLVPEEPEEKPNEPKSRGPEPRRNEAKKIK